MAQVNCCLICEKIDGKIRERDCVKTRQVPPQSKFNCHSVKRKCTTLPTHSCVYNIWQYSLNTFNFVVPSTACCCAAVAVVPTTACVHSSQSTKTKCPVKRGRHIRNLLHPLLQPLNGWQTGKSSFLETRIVFQRDGNREQLLICYQQRLFSMIIPVRTTVFDYCENTKYITTLTTILVSVTGIIYCHWNADHYHWFILSVKSLVSGSLPSLKCLEILISYNFLIMPLILSFTINTVRCALCMLSSIKGTV
jgi:hypothetical protein